jgi:hypothetical protein
MPRRRDNKGSNICSRYKWQSLWRPRAACSTSHSLAQAPDLDVILAPRSLCTCTISSFDRTYLRLFTGMQTTRAPRFQTPDVRKYRLLLWRPWGVIKRMIGGSDMPAMADARHGSGTGVCRTVCAMYRNGVHV